ncbi:MAG: hypothetical protein MJ217_03115 [Bacilli bacterium]|nr:hypothetical protein [Bacilli bacterium]
MAKTKKTTEKAPSFEETNEIKKLCLYVTIVNQGQANSVISLFRRIGSAAQFVQVGTGTATKEVYDILGMEDNSKEIVLCMIKKDDVEDARVELEAFFKANKRNRGIGFAIDLTTMIGVRLYRFLTDSLK